MFFNDYINITYIEEANNYKALDSQLAILYEHMLKWQYHPVKQSKSWMNSILNSHIEICMLNNNKFWNKVDIVNSFKNGRDKAISLEGKEFDNIYPKELPLNWGRDNITNKYFIADYLRKYYNHDVIYKFDLNGTIYKKLGI